jgi:hypothetical protein
VSVNEYEVVAVTSTPATAVRAHSMSSGLLGEAVPWFVQPVGTLMLRVPVGPFQSHQATSRFPDVAADPNVTVIVVVFDVPVNLAD